jgi:hypothetical protein
VTFCSFLRLPDRPNLGCFFGPIWVTVFFRTTLHHFWRIFKKTWNCRKSVFERLSTPTGLQKRGRDVKMEAPWFQSDTFFWGLSPFLNNTPSLLVDFHWPEIAERIAKRGPLFHKKKTGTSKWRPL